MGFIDYGFSISIVVIIFIAIVIALLLRSNTKEIEPQYIEND